MKGKRGQITIFIIIAIVLVVALLLIFNLQIRNALSNIITGKSPSIKLQDCVGEDLKKVVSDLSLSGGSLNVVNGYMYQGVKVDYLCYTNQYYQTCVNQQPLLKQHIEREILDYMSPKVKICMDKIKQDFQSRGYDVNEGKQTVSVSILPENIRVSISGVTVSKADTGEMFAKFDLNYKSQMYDLIMLTNSIINYEARYGDSEIMTYMGYYPNMKVEKYKQEDGSKIYKLTEEGGDKFTFATRSLSWPNGYGIGEVFTPIR